MSRERAFAPLLAARHPEAAPRLVKRVASIASVMGPAPLPLPQKRPQSEGPNRILISEHPQVTPPSSRRFAALGIGRASDVAVSMALRNTPTEAPSVAPEGRAYIPWATRQKQAKKFRTGPVHGNPHLVPHLTPFSSEHKPGTVVVHVKEKRLYLVQSKDTALVYPIGTAHGGVDVLGETRITTRRRRPSWTPTPNQRRRDPTLPRRVEAGPDNPLGIRALGLGWRYRLIHGTSDPSSIGHALSDGCIRMLNEDVIDLFDRVKVGNRVLVLASAAAPLREWRPSGYVEYKPRKRLRSRKWRKKRLRSKRRYASRRAKRKRRR